MGAITITSAEGLDRVYEGSWFMGFHSNHEYEIAGGGSKNVVIGGFDPTRWGLANLDSYPSRLDATSGDFNVELYDGYIRLENTSNYSATFKFTVLRGQ